jgi:hypothetical protein
MSTCTCTCACACACACACVHVHVACACACISCIHASVGRGVGACRWVDGCTRLFLTLTACFIQWVLLTTYLLTYLLTYLSFSGSYLLLTYLLTYLVSNYLLTTYLLTYSKVKLKSAGWPPSSCLHVLRRLGVRAHGIWAHRATRRGLLPEAPRLAGSSS